MLCLGVIVMQLMAAPGGGTALFNVQYHALHVMSSMQEMCNVV
jgi:hypothetical protein